MGKDSEQIAHSCSRPIGFLFDLDGVLIDSERSYTRFWAGVDRLYPTGVEDFPRKIKGTTLNDILSRYFPDPEVRTIVEKMCWDEEKKIIFGYETGARELLIHLKQLGIPTALVTSSDGVKMANLWKQIPDLRSLLTAVIDAEAVTRSKPDPEGYLKGASALGLKPEHCVVFEDSLTGVKAGRASGSYVVGMSATLGRDAIQPYCDLVLDSLEELELEALIEALRNRR